MSKLSVDVAVIGAGTAGLSAIKEIKKNNQTFVLIDPGPLGTTCARVGCMPSKALIQCANSYHLRHHFSHFGIDHSEQLTVDMQRVLAHVRQMRDSFTAGVVKSTLALGDNYINGQAKFITPHQIEVDGETIEALKTVVATGSKSHIPRQWQDFHQDILTSETIFEQKKLPTVLPIIGGGVIGLELGQALSRLGIDITLFHSKEMIAGLTDPEINKEAIAILRAEFRLLTNAKAQVKQVDASLITFFEQTELTSQKILAAIGRRPNIEQLDLNCFDIEYDNKDIPLFDSATMKVNNAPIFMAGDVTTTKPLLHEAADEGRIAGYNVCQKEPTCFQRRVPLTIIFTQPNIAMVGKSYADLQQEDFVTGTVDFSDQGRSKLMRENKGKLNLYVRRTDARVLGAEMIAPDGEHLAHLLAWAIQTKMTVKDMLKLPFYHPVVEEGLRTALRDALMKIEEQGLTHELALCHSRAIDSLN